MIHQIILDIRSFAVVLTAIVVGFSMILYNLGNRKGLPQKLLESYNVVYSEFGDNAYETIEQAAFTIIVSIFLSVVLLNLLIAIMGNSYERVQDNQVPADNQEKIKQIVGALQKRKLCVRRKPKINGSFLFMVMPGTEDAAVVHKGIHWEGGLRTLKSTLQTCIEELNFKLKEFASHIQEENQVETDMKKFVNKKLESFLSCIDLDTGKKAGK